MNASISAFSIPQLPNVSLVAFYQNKPSQLTNLIQTIIAEINRSSLSKSNFLNYQLEQIHGTILGCEGVSTSLGIINKWFYEFRQKTRYVNLSGWLNFLQNQVKFPIIIRFGGYHPQVNYHFLSRQQHPSIRTFQLQSSGEDNFVPVLIGWSFTEQKITLDIEKLRRQAQQFNLLHKYHQTPNSIDNDFYLRLGTIKGKLSANEIFLIEQKIRENLQLQPPFYVSINQNDLAFVKYQDLTLPLETTEILPLTEATETKLQRLYANSDTTK
ncbi:hypothetical protein Sta7437_1152 [Stanieria cyanosphaera PCC 7437]|uniref:Uncharacterized protein n=1 Tax=Stanieria cyanosphaera (strain ATCC 29371 / PCC 7437) TaxID=111780 RepID=K9XQD2_STAC7|nr:hypothetical protein [Stanieria cyanosphaera]AFZ34723.1 hypothetical protein Sta7437_1152 [Stanieria cyanosphaera PCC 7437]